MIALVAQREDQEEAIDESGRKHSPPVSTGRVAPQNARNGLIRVWADPATGHNPPEPLEEALGKLVDTDQKTEHEA